MKKLSERNIFLASTVLHTGFIAWLTLGEPFFLVFVFATVSTLTLLPISYWVISSIFRFIETKFPDIAPIKNKTTTTLILSEAVFMMIFIISAISMVFINGTEEYSPPKYKPSNVIIQEQKTIDTQTKNNIIEIQEDKVLTEYSHIEDSVKTK